MSEQFSKITSLPATVMVSDVVTSRYPVNKRPALWDRRKAGVDVVRTSDGQVLKLWSDGQQSPPSPGWTLVLREGDENRGYSWTLYGIPPRN